jgi:hypothetical protein
VDCPRGPAGQLLEDDRADQRAEVPVGIARPVGDRSDESDEVGQHGIPLGHVVDGGC